MYCHIFIELHRKYFSRKISASEHRAHILGKHSGIAPRNENLKFILSYPSGKMLPAFHILDFIKKQHRAFVTQSGMHFKNHIQISQFHPRKTLILKIQIYNIIPGISLGYQLLNFTIEKIWFSRTTHANQYLTVKSIQWHISFDHFMTHNLFPVFQHHFPKNFILYHTTYCLTYRTKLHIFCLKCKTKLQYTCFTKHKFTFQ